MSYTLNSVKRIKSRLSVVRFGKQKKQDLSFAAEKCVLLSSSDCEVGNNLQ